MVSACSGDLWCPQGELLTIAIALQRQGPTKAAAMAAKRLTRRQAIRWISCAAVVVLLVVSCVLSAALTEDQVQQWLAANADYDWQQSVDTRVRVQGRGAQDSGGNLYFAGTKTYPNAAGEYIDDQNMFVACIQADDTLGWTKEFGTNQTDGANYITIMNETTASGVAVQYLYVVGWTWGFMDDGGHALNGFGRFGGRDVVLLKLRLQDGRKIWSRQFGTTADDMGYGVQRDGSFDTLLLTGATMANQVDAVVEMDVDIQDEPRQRPFSIYETQLMDARARQGVRTMAQYQFAASLKRNGDITDFAMDGGITLSSRRQRTSENSTLPGEYVVVLNRQPLDDVVITATIVCLPNPADPTKTVQQLSFVSSSTIERKITFTRQNWNREQYVSVKAVDDRIAEGVHYAVVTHVSASKDPHFDGVNTPFLYGRNVTIQIEDNDVAGIHLSRRHLFVAEGNVNDTYAVVLRSQPWHSVTVTIVSLHSSQAFPTPSTLVFEPGNWNVSQTVTVAAVDDSVSENEYGGLHYGGRLLHFSTSKDRRYSTGRPRCFDVPRCDPQDASSCLSDDTEATSVRVCDMTTPNCGARLGNGACIAQVFPSDPMPPVRFGLDQLLSSEPTEDVTTSFDYAAFRVLLADQARDVARVSPATNISAVFPFQLPPPRLRGFVLSFLGVLNLGQALQLHQDFYRSLQAVCNGLDRLSTHHWTTQSWPEASFPRVLNATLKMFGGSVSQRHLWQCGMASFRPASDSINISVWDNDAGVTLSNRELFVAESDDGDISARYSIVLNAPPSAGGSPKLQKPFCSANQSNFCGLWSDFQSLATSVYQLPTQLPLPNVSIAIVGNSQLTVSPSVVTFTTADWFVPQWITVRAVNDAIAEPGVASFTLTHRVQSAQSLGYSDETTAFWFRSSSQSMLSQFPRWINDSQAASIPYNFLPRVLHSPRHKQINVRVSDDDAAGVIINEMQPQGQVKTRESDDVGDDWVGDAVTSLAFSDVSLTQTASSALSGGVITAALQSVLVFEKNAVTFLKFHLPERHEGDTQPAFSFATLRVYETPFKVVNASSSSSSDTDSASSSSTAFETLYQLRITVVDNAWTRSGVSNGSVDPVGVQFLQGDHTIDVTALLTKQRFVAIDVTPLLKRLLPTRLPVVSLKIQVLNTTSTSDTGGSTAQITTQLCSSLFERALRPSLQLGYAFPNRFLGATTTQSSTVENAALAVDGRRLNGSATQEEEGPWWEVSLPKVTRLGSIAIFVPREMASADVVESPVVLVVVASLVPLNGQQLSLADASKAGCPDACALVQRLSLRKSLIITELNVGVRALRIYREGFGQLNLSQVEAYDPHIVLTPTANGAGLRTRLKTDWNGRFQSDSWQLLQSTRQSEDENVARGMRTRQSSTDPAPAVSSLAVDGRKHSQWDALVWTDSSSQTQIAGSTRTKAENDPWWEVDLGSTVSIAKVQLYPYIGERGRSFCGSSVASNATNNSTVPSWAGDLFSFSKTDARLQLQDPFEQTFTVVLSDGPLTDSASSIIASKSLQFSCAGGVSSISWLEVFSNARYVTVKRPGIGVVLMLNEVVVTRWNPATTPQFLLVDLRSKGDLPLALSSIQIFPPTDENLDGSSSFSLPIEYSIHSVSSQRASSGDGSAAALISATTADCYVASKASYREWIVLKLTKPTRVGLIDVQTSIDKCGTGVASITAFSVSARGASLEGMRSATADAALSATASTACLLTALAQYTDAAASKSSCVAFSCDDASCRADRKTADTSLAFSDCNDIVLLGVPTRAPITRLPLVQQEARTLPMRDNPVTLWTFDTEPRTVVSAGRTTTTFQLTGSATFKSLDIDDDMEQTFFSNAVAVQPAMSAFTIELWVQLAVALTTPLTVSTRLVTLANGAKTPIADVKWTPTTPQGVFTVRDPDSSASCRAMLPSPTVFDVAGRWYHVVASYDPSNAQIQFSVRFKSSNDAVVSRTSYAACNLPLLNAKHKTIQVGAFNTSVGFVGRVANVAWYADVLNDRQSLDHFHDFLDRSTRASLHNSYAVRLASQPTMPVVVEMNAESACYHFSLCNVSVIPRTLQFSSEDWNVSKFVRVVATDDQLYEGLHDTLVLHQVSSVPTYEMQSVVITEDLVGDESGKWKQYKNAVFGYARAAVFTAEPQANMTKRQAQLDEIHSNWSTQIVNTSFVERDPYASDLTVRDVDIVIEDATVPGIEFSTSSLTVSEDGKANDYQILLLSEPTSDVFVVLDTQSDCYRDCFVDPVCPSVKPSTDTQRLSCGGGSAAAKLCNITVSPDVLVFTPLNWSFPQTVRVLAVDDLLDEADVHLTTIKATSRSLDPIYDALFLPDIVVAVEDNDNTGIDYSTLQVSMQEKSTSGTQYNLTLVTEPWANVTIAMSNEADGLCYRPCGYPFDEKDCGLPRQQSVSSVRLATNSPREIHEITMQLPKPRVMEVQRIVTYSSHLDHTYDIQVTGGFAPEVQTIEFLFNSVFKGRFTSAAAILAASYIKTFTIGIDGKTATASLDGFASAAQVEAAVNGLLLGRTSTDTAVRVSRELFYDQSVLRWQITFLRFMAQDLTFPQFTVTPYTPFEGTLRVTRVAFMTAPSGSLELQYGVDNSAGSKASFPLLTSTSDIEPLLRDLDVVYTALVSRRIVTSSPPVFGLIFSVTFTSVESYQTLRASNVSLISASAALSPPITVQVSETQTPVRIGGFFAMRFDSLYVNSSVNATVPVRETGGIAWNASAAIVASELARLHGVGNVSVSRRQISPEGGMDWTVGFITNNGDLPLLQAKSLNLTGTGVSVETFSVTNGTSLGGGFSVEMGGKFTKMHPTTKRVYYMDIAKQNTTLAPFNITADALTAALMALNVTEMPTVTRTGVDCDGFEVCEGYVWTISYTNSAGNVPPIQVYGTNTTLTGAGAVVSARTVANGTYLSGSFSLELELFDVDVNTTYRAKTWNLPVNVSTAGMDEAIEAIFFVRSNREGEYDPETRVSRGPRFDKGVRVSREGPYLDGGHTWRLEWAIDDYVRFQDLKVTVNTTLVTQLIEPFPVASERDLTGTPRCNAIPKARFEPDTSDPFGLRGACVYDIVNVTIQERFLCNYTVENPWIVFQPRDWCVPQRVELTPVDDFIDEITIKNGNITYSNVTHTVFSDDLIYSALPLKQIQVTVENDDVARVIVSESQLAVSEDGAVVAYYELQLTTEPLYDVKIVVLPWLDSANTKCYRFGLCNVTLPVDTFIFTPRNWNVRQRVVVRATDDKLDEYDFHETGISHVSYSDDLKYHQRTDIPKIQVTVADNDNSAFYVSRPSVNVTEGGRNDTYELVLGSEPFAKVTVTIQNVGVKGDFATTDPQTIVFTWLNWNVPQTINVIAVDDDTEDPLDSSSVMVHTIRTNDLIYAGLKNLDSVKVWIQDNDKSGIALSTLAMNVSERAESYNYSVRLTSEPWFPVVVTSNGSHGCYLRVATQVSVCNVSITTAPLYFGAGNWSTPQLVEFLAFDDSLEETPIHNARITHSSTSKDPLYVAARYPAQRLALAITDNDKSFVTISLAINGTSRTRLHVAEGGFTDSYSVVLTSEPYEDVLVTVRPVVERIVSVDTALSAIDAAQVSASVGSALSTVPSGSFTIVFTPLDWFKPRVVVVAGVDDQIPEDPTQFSSIVHAVVSADAKYNISNASLGIVDVAVIISDRETIPPPLPVSSVFDGSGTRLLITFGSSVYHASTMLIRASSTGSAYAPRSPSFNCSLVFSLSLVSLGAGPSCAWRSDLMQLIVTLGTNASILPNDVLLFYDCTSFVNQICQSTSVLRARHTSRGYTQATVTMRLDPTNTVKPKIVLSAPEQVGTCGSWQLDASLSSGSAGRAWKEQTWFALPRAAVASSGTVTAETWLATSATLYPVLAPICLKYRIAEWLIELNKTELPSSVSVFVSTLAQLRSACYLRALAVNGTNARTPQIPVNSSRLQFDTTYVVGLSLANAFSQQTAVAQTVYVGKLPSPIVFAVGANSLQITRGESTQPVSLQADATLSCPLLAGSVLSFKWYATVSDSSSSSSVQTAVDLNATNTARDPRNFRVPRSQLLAGKTYRFRVDASVPNASISSAFFTVAVATSPLLSSLQGGSRGVGEKDPLVLNGSLSVDPDDAIQPFEYSWRCEDWTNETLATSLATNASFVPCLNASSLALNPIALPVSSSRSTLTIDPFTLLPLRTFRFYLTVSKTTTTTTTTTSRNATAQTTVWTLAGSVPEISIQASAMKLNPTSRLTLEGVVKSTYPYVARWVEDEGDLHLPDQTSNITTHDAFTMELTSPSNAIRRNKLTPGQHYVLRLLALDINGNQGFGLITFQVNAPPSPGQFIVSPREGDAMKDEFLLDCAQWTDDAEDLPLRYSFGVLPSLVFESLELNLTLIRQRMLPVVTEQLSPSARVTMLPPEGGVDSASVTIVAFVTDAMGSVAMAYDSITVRMPATAKTQPIAFVSSLLNGSDSALMASSDSATKSKYLLSAAMVMQSAMAGDTGPRTACPGDGSESGVCSGNGQCDLATFICACESDFMGTVCEFQVSDVRATNDMILTSLASSAVQVVEPSSSGLSQQARVIDTVLGSSSAAFNGDGLGQVTALSSSIAENAFALDDTSSFVDTTGATLLSALSTVLSVRATTDDDTNDETPAPARRLTASSSSGTGASCSQESAQAQKSFQQLLGTLQSVATLASQDLLPGEAPARMSSGQIATIAGAGSRLADSTSSFAINLTSIAVTCLSHGVGSSDLFLNAFQLAAASHHPACSLTDTKTISKSTVVTVHSRAALAAALSGKSNGVVSTLSLASDSPCVVQAAKAAASPSTTSRRLSSGTNDTFWQPLVALSIPHARELSAIEQRNFSTVCRAWNAKNSSWDRDVCYKDDTQSTPRVTVCFCSELGSASDALEVLVTLEERLDFYALDHELFRDDSPSIVGSVSMAVLVALFALGSRVAKRKDQADDKREKEKTIKNLNRSKWAELRERTLAEGDAAVVIDDFAAYMANREKQLLQEKQPQAEASGVALTAATSDSQLVVASQLLEAASDGSVAIPNETRVLFGSSDRLQAQYSVVTSCLRGSNVLLLILGVVAAFIGIDFYAVLGNSTSSELVLFLYGKPIGLVLLAFGGTLAVLGLWGFILCRSSTESSAHLAGSSHVVVLQLCLLGQLFFVFLAFRYLNDLQELPLPAVGTLQSVWNALSSQLQDEIQNAYGCCGFQSVADAATSTQGCPEEALDASPPRTCLRVVQSNARGLFETSFVYLQAVFLVQLAAWLLIQTLRTWRRLRLNQLAGESANSRDGETTADRFVLASVVDVALHCTLPSILQLLVCLTVLVLFNGVDLIAQLHVLSNALLSGLLGVEIGVVFVVAAVVYAIVLVQGLHGLRTRDARRLQSFAALTTACLLLSVALFVFVDGLHDHWLLDPAIVDFVHTKYVQLARETLVAVETSLECCGFDSHSEGACIPDVALPTCRALVLGVLHRELSLLSDRVLGFVFMQGIVTLLAIVISVRMKRFALTRLRIQPLETADTPEPPVVLTSFAHALVHYSSFCVIVLVSAVAFVFGLVVIGAGLDAMYQLNVLHISSLLRVFDRHVAVYLLSAGSAISLFGLLGLSLVWSSSQRTRRRLAIAFVSVSMAIFVAAFGLSGFAHRFAHFSLTDEAVDERLETFWVATSPTTTRVFLQNSLSCCGFHKVERANGSVVFTDAGERAAWRLSSDTLEADTYTTIAPTTSQRRRLSVKLTQSRRLSQVACPETASEPCAPRLKSYVRRVASRTFQISVALLACVAAVVVAVGGLLWQPEASSGGPDKASWLVVLARTALALLCTASLFTSLASFFLGLDIVTHWSLFSSSMLQLVFPRSIGVAFFLLAAYLAFVNAYAVLGLAQRTVHRVFMQSLGRVFLILCGWLCVGLTGYASHYGGSEVTWQRHLHSFLDRQWSELSPSTQHRISLENQCCGFNDPVVVKGKGIVFDRPAQGYACSLAAARGCRHPLEAQIGGSFAWLFQYSLTLTLLEMLALACSVLVLRHLKRVKPHDWFVIESRIRFAMGKYKSEVRKTHVLVSLSSQFDRKYTRVQRLTSVLCGVLTSLAAYTAWFAHQGCHRHALKTCRQPDAWAFLGMGLLYGGLLGFASQLAARALFEAVRNRSEEETAEVAVARQRKEKALLFRGFFSRKDKPLSDISQTSAVKNLATSQLEAPAHATTEERWYAWLARFTHTLFCVMGVLLFLFGLGLATFMALVLLGFKNAMYGVVFDQGPKETLVFGVAISATALFAWLAIDIKNKRNATASGRSVFVFIAVAIAALLLLGGLCMGIFMASQTLDEDSTNWTIRNTAFSVPQRLETAWKADATGFVRHRIQQELQCCGFRSSQDKAFRPCPQGTTVQVDYQAVRVDGRVIASTKDELVELAGCYAQMLAQFHTVLDQVAYVAAAVGVALLLLAASALFLARDVSISKDSKLKLRVTKTSSTNEVRQTFEKVVGLKIAAPARGKILSKMLSTSLENVAPHVVSELAAESLALSSAVPPPGQQPSTVTLPSGQVVSSSLATNRWDAVASAAAAAQRNVPYPAWVTRVVFAVCGLWLVTICYVIVVNSLQLGVETAWRCIAAWAVGVFFHLGLVEPLVVFVRLLWSTLGQWWDTTMLARVIRYGRNALRVRPSADVQAARYYASLSLYERIRFNAAVRIQRRLLTRLERRRFLKKVREHREEAHRALVARRRLTLKQAIDGFSAEEIEAFRLLFQDADTARLELVSYKVISQSIYQLGVRVEPALVRQFLMELDPAYADLVDFEHFLYGMHRVRVHHQEEQAVVEVVKAQAADEREAAAIAKEEFVSSSSRFGPNADPQSRVFVKRQNLLRELREKRESLSYRLMSKVNKLPPILQRGKSARAATPAEELRRGASAASDLETEDLLEEAATVDDAPPTGSYVLLQNRKLSPKKRALEMMLKKKSRDEKDKVKEKTTEAGSSGMRKIVSNLRMPGSPRARSQKPPPVELLKPPTAELAFPTIDEGDEAEPPSPQKTAAEADKQAEEAEDVAVAVAAAPAVEEAKPFGTFMLMAKQATTTGKSKVMEKILQKQTEQKAEKAAEAAKAKAKEDGDDSDDDAEAAAESQVREPTETAAESRPTTAEKREKANSIAKSSLEKALKKKATATTRPAASSPKKR